MENLDYKIKNFEKIFASLVFLIFGIAFFLKEHYVLSFACLPFLLILIRIDDLKKLILNKSGVHVNFGKLNKVEDRIEDVVNNKVTPARKIKQLQKITDEAFKMGYLAGAGKVNDNINNVKIIKDRKGKITEIQYDEF
ncbi:MAG TPA: hypothetical protein VHE53_00135 [Patescibacteria group bacterium]|nr:hypothetical protein [Patescibacteria group bacterium]